MTEYALEGSVFIAGAAVQWLRDGLGIIASAAETEKLAMSVADNHGVYFVLLSSASARRIGIRRRAAQLSG